MQAAVSVTCICSCVPSVPLAQEKEKTKTEVSFACSENLEWIPLLCVDVEIFLCKDPCPTSWRICGSNLVAVKPSLSHPWAPGVPVVLGSAQMPGEGKQFRGTSDSQVPDSCGKSVREEHPFPVPLGPPLTLLTFEAGGTQISDPCSCERDAG